EVAPAGPGPLPGPAEPGRGLRPRVPGGDAPGPAVPRRRARRWPRGGEAAGGGPGRRPGPPRRAGRRPRPTPRRRRGVGAVVRPCPSALRRAVHCRPLPAAARPGPGPGGGRAGAGGTAVKVLHVVPAIAERYGGPSRAVVEMGRALIGRGVDT